MIMNKGECMEISVKSQQRKYFAKRFLLSLFWVIFWYSVCYIQIEFFYGPGAEFTNRYPYEFGLICGVDFTGFFISTGYFLVRLTSLLCFGHRIQKSMKHYLPAGASEPFFSLLDKDIRCRLFETSEVYMGNDWIVFPGRAMYREAICGIFYEDLSLKYLSKKVRLFLVDEQGERMYLDVSKKHHPSIYAYLCERHPTAAYGEKQVLSDFISEQNSQFSEEAIDYRRLRKEAAYPLGVSPWDKNEILEDNCIRCEYERWLLAAYSTYIAGDIYYDGNFEYAGGYEKTTLQKRFALEILQSSWDIRSKEQLIYTTNRLIISSRSVSQPKGWQLGRVVMLYGFGYISGILSRQEMLQFSLGVAAAIQQNFSSWKELLDSHMEGYEAWVKKKIPIERRRKVYESLLSDPSSVVNTVSFQADLRSLYCEAAGIFGIDCDQEV